MFVLGWSATNEIGDSSKAKPLFKHMESNYQYSKQFEAIFILDPRAVPNKAIFSTKAAEFRVETDSKWQEWAGTPRTYMLLTNYSEWWRSSPGWARYLPALLFVPLMDVPLKSSINKHTFLGSLQRQVIGPRDRAVIEVPSDEKSFNYTPFICRIHSEKL